jgi:hypothetical protein
VARAKRRTPYDPSKAHDRRATDFNRGIAQHVAPIEVDDPFAEGEKIIVMRAIRTDSLGRLHAHKQIDEAQYQAGRAFQDDWETVQGQQQACDPSQPYVDQSFRPRGISKTHSEALVRLNRAHRDLGLIGSAVASDVLIHGKSMTQIAADRGYIGRGWDEFFGKRFRECLDCLALAYGFAMEKR